MYLFARRRAHAQDSAFIRSAIISSPLRRLAQSSRTAGTARQHTPIERVLDLFPEAGIPHRVAAMRIRTILRGEAKDNACPYDPIHATAVEPNTRPNSIGGDFTSTNTVSSSASTR